MSRRGLTLLEIMIALGITSFTLLTMIGVYASGLHLMARSKGITTGTELGREVLEMAREQGFTSVPAEEVTYDGRVPDPGHAFLGFPPEPYPAATVDGKTYPMVVKVSPVSDQLKSITVQVYYDGGSKVTLQTLLKP
ncbi:MAG: hypothetical protein HY319_00555 [Armatimonadetes bacterium]|nr:hypothetical protein [Armatimonadota bacterium]